MSDENKGRRKSNSKSDDADARPQSTVVTPDNQDAEELALWIQRLWRDDAAPQKITVVQMYDRGRTPAPTPIDREDFRPGSPMDQERAVDLANRFVGAAQRDCDRIVRKEQSYGVIAFDTNRAAEEFRRYPLLLRPKTLMVPASRRNVADDTDDEEALTMSNLSLKYMERLLEAGKFDKEHYAGVFGETFLLYKNELAESRSYMRELQTLLRETVQGWVTAIRGQEAALSLAEDRYIKREMTKLKVDLMKDGFRTARNLLPMLFGGGETQPQLPAGSVAAGSNGAQAVQQPMRPKTREQILIENFLLDCESTGISVQLFGDWVKEDGKLKQTAPGVFTPDQFLTLVKVQHGALEVEALDGLLPDSGSPIAITPEQQGRAAPLLSEGVASALMELFSLRIAARATAQAQAQAQK